MPPWEEFVRPPLEVLADGSVRRRRELHELTVDRLGLTPEQRAETLSSGQYRSVNRSGWAVTELFKAGALDRPERATYAINELGRSLLAHYPNGITRNDLLEIPAYRAYIEASRGSSRSAGSATDVVSEETELDPVEQIEQGQRLKADVATRGVPGRRSRRNPS